VTKRDDIICEPRALWSVERIQADATQSGVAARLLEPGRFLLDKRHWYNGSKYPLVLTHLLYAGINYTLREPSGAAGFHDGASWINRAEVLVSAPYRQHFSRQDHAIVAFAPEAAEGPGMRYAEATPHISSLFGINRWSFDFEDGDFWLPAGGSIQMDFSGAGMPNIVGITGTSTSSFLFDEEWEGGGWVRRNARLSERDTHNAARADDVYPAGRQPFPVDTLGQANGPLVPFWQGRAPFLPDAYRLQEANRGAKRNRVSGFAVAMDQIDHDEELEAQGFTTPASPLSMRVATRARTTGGGTQRWWWREGAPLCLVCPTLTPAAVHRFDRPVVLGKGDSLAIEVRVPDRPASQEAAASYTFGVSALGYAIIEG